MSPPATSKTTESPVNDANAPEVVLGQYVSRILITLGTTFTGHVERRAAAEVFTASDDHGLPAPMACVSEYALPPESAEALTIAIGSVHSGGRFELLNPRACMETYTFPAFRPDTLVEVFVLDDDHDADYVRQVAPIIHAARLNETAGVDQLLQLAFMNASTDAPFSLKFAEAFRDRVFGHHAVRHGISLQQLLTHFGLPLTRVEKFKKRKQALGLTRPAAHHKATSRRRPATPTPALPPKTPSNLSGRNPAATAPPSTSAPLITNEVELRQYWKDTLEPLGMPPFDDVVSATRYWTGDMHLPSFVKECLEHIKDGAAQPMEHYEALKAMLLEKDLDVDDQEELRRVLRLMSDT